MLFPEMANGATCITQGHHSNSVLGGTEDAEKQNLDNTAISLNLVNTQAARYVAKRCHVPMPTASLIAALAGLGVQRG